MSMAPTAINTGNVGAFSESVVIHLIAIAENGFCLQTKFN